MERSTGQEINESVKEFEVDPWERLYDKFIFAGMILVIVFGFSVVSLIALTIWGV